MLRNERQARMTIGVRSSFGANCEILWPETFATSHPDRPTVTYVRESRLEIGKFTCIGSYVRFYLGGNHAVRRAVMYPVESLKEKNAQQWTGTRGDIVIGNDVWVADDAIIMSGVRIGSGAAIGAGAVVRRDVPDYAVAYGNPAQVVRLRLSEADAARMLKLAWWDWPLDAIAARSDDLIFLSPEALLNKYGGKP